MNQIFKNNCKKQKYYKDIDSLQSILSNSLSGLLSLLFLSWHAFFGWTLTTFVMISFTAGTFEFRRKRISQKRDCF